MGEDEARDGIPMPPGMSREEFDALVGTDSDMMDMAATGKQIFDQYEVAGFSSAQALYFTVAVLSGNPLLPPKM